MKRHVFNALLLGGMLTLVGCGPPQVKPNNLRLIASLRTALSAKNSEWLKQNVDLIEKRRAEGQMSDEEYAEFQAIVAKAKSGDWSGAERDAVAFQKAQRPTPEQVERVEQVTHHAH
jgi:hypothetical protein